MTLATQEIIAVVVSLAALLIYHIFYYKYILQPFQDSSQLLSNYKNPYIWVSKHFNRPDAANSTLGLHVLRNFMLIGIFVGGNSFSIAYTYLNSVEYLNADTIQGVRGIIVSAFLFSSFLSWVSVIRGASHLGYLLGVSVDDEISDTTGETYINRMESLKTSMAYHFSVGFRFIFVSIPFALLGAGITALVVSTFFMLLFLFELDYQIFTGNKNSSAKVMRRSASGFSYTI